MYRVIPISTSKRGLPVREFPLEEALSRVWLGDDEQSVDSDVQSVHVVHTADHFGGNKE